jgi:hypothetical protein
MAVPEAAKPRPGSGFHLNRPPLDSSGTLGDSRHFCARLQSTPEPEMPKLVCPSCGLAVSADLINCPLCRAPVSTPNLRRVLLWTTVVVEYLCVAVVSLRA